MANNRPFILLRVTNTRQRQGRSGLATTPIAGNVSEDLVEVDTQFIQGLKLPLTVVFHLWSDVDKLGGVEMTDRSTRDGQPTSDFIRFFPATFSFVVDLKTIQADRFDPDAVFQDESMVNQIHLVELLEGADVSVVSSKHQTGVNGVLTEVNILDSGEWDGKTMARLTVREIPGGGGEAGFGFGELRVKAGAEDPSDATDIAARAGEFTQGSQGARSLSRAGRHACVKVKGQQVNLADSDFYEKGWDAAKKRVQRDIGGLVDTVFGEDDPKGGFHGPAIPSETWISLGRQSTVPSTLLNEKEKRRLEKRTHFLEVVRDPDNGLTEGIDYRIKDTTGVFGFALEVTGSVYNEFPPPPEPEKC